MSTVSPFTRLATRPQLIPLRKGGPPGTLHQTVRISMLWEVHGPYSLMLLI